jgi:UDP-N-acetylglucosamine 2-epimerase (non-hydrolysing)
MKRVLIVFGTRPEAIKMAPVIKELHKYPDNFKTLVCVTAQHREMLDQVLDLFDIVPDYDLDIMKPGQDLFDITCNVLQGLKNVLKKEKPDIVLVHGDTTTTMAGALAAFYCRVPVGHVEAGLRTQNKYSPFPEEINRSVAGVLTDFHFAPTEFSRQNLLREGVDPDRIYVTGNTVIDALFMILEKIRTENMEEEIIQQITYYNPTLHRVLSELKLNTIQNSKFKIQNTVERRLILVTGHRRENFGDGFENICLALHDIANSNPYVDILYPVHLNPNVQEPVRRILGESDLINIHLIEPVSYLPFVWLMNKAHIIITDSGGVQEEAPSLGKPVLVMRETTERPEAINAGTVKLVATDRKRICSVTQQLLDEPEIYNRMSMAHNPYGDGMAAKRILACLASERLQYVV